MQGGPGEQGGKVRVQCAFVEQVCDKADRVLLEPGAEILDQGGLVDGRFSFRQGARDRHREQANRNQLCQQVSQLRCKMIRRIGFGA